MIGSDAIRDEILGIIRNILPDEDFPELNDNVSLREQLELDSMDFLDIVMELRKRHGIHVAEEDYKELTTLNSAVAYLQTKLTAS